MIRPFLQTLRRAVGAEPIDTSTAALAEVMITALVVVIFFALCATAEAA